MRLTASQVARFWRKTPQAVGLWVKNEGCPRNDDGTFSLPDVIAWREAKLSGQSTGDRDTEETRRIAALADTYEFKLAVMRGEYMPADAVASMWADRVTAARTALMGLGASIGPSLIGLDAVAVKRLIDGRVRTVLEDLAREFEQALHDAEDEETNDS